MTVQTDNDTQQSTSLSEFANALYSKVTGAANNTSDVDVADGSVVAPFDAPESPRSMAVRRNELEHEFHNVSKIFDSQLCQIQLAISRLKADEVNDSNAEHQKLKLQLVDVQQRRDEFQRGKEAAVASLDLQISKAHQAQACTMKELAKKVKRIEVTDEDGTIATLAPVHYFSDLQAYLENSYPRHTSQLFIAGTKKSVNTEFELQCAYEDVSTGVLELSVKLKLKQQQLKRRLSDPDDAQSVLTVLQHTGPWNATEQQLFKSGVARHGWGQWAKIAGVVETRSREQVRSFARTETAQRYKYAASLVPALSNLAEGLNNMSKCLKTDQSLGVDQLLAEDDAVDGVKADICDDGNDCDVGVDSTLLDITKSGKDE
ncbi:hypothetical protein MP228_007244 [Amoeboaphelidium protococcarum]|nr:hypothetical protein MP228_007244 [Amoeboaphelidium protococcarum]